MLHRGPTTLMSVARIRDAWGFAAKFTRKDCGFRQCPSCEQEKWIVMFSRCCSITFALRTSAKGISAHRSPLVTSERRDCEKFVEFMGWGELSERRASCWNIPKK